MVCMRQWAWCALAHVCVVHGGCVSWSLVGKETTPSAWHPQIGVGLNTMPPRCAGNLGLDVKGVYMCQWDQKKKQGTHRRMYIMSSMNATLI